MAYDAITERLISIKKLSGKAQTSNDKGLANEGLPSGLTVSFVTVFGEAIPTVPASTNLYDRTGTGDGQVEYVRFVSTFIAGSDTTDGRHGFELKLPSDYESNSSNPLAGTYPFKNNQTVNITSGTLQLVPPSFATAYEAKPFYGGSGTKDSGTQIPVLDSRDWYMDYFNGIFFQQDPPGTGDHGNNPDFVEGFLYIGKYLDGILSSGDITGVTAGTGLTGGGLSGNVTLAINDSVVATLSGSQFSGNVGVTSDLNVTGSVRTVGDVYIAYNDSSADAGALYFGDPDAAIGSSIKASTGGTQLNIRAPSNLYLQAGSNFRMYVPTLLDFNANSSAGSAPTFIFGGNESSQERSLLTMKGTDNTVFILSGGAGSSNNERSYTDTAFFVSGSIGSRGTSTRGTSVFGGDVFISGSVYDQNGQIGTITRQKVVERQTTETNANQNVTLVGLDMSTGKFDSNYIDVYVNGQILMSGTVSQTLNGEVDYTSTGNNSLKFSFDIESDDIISVLVLPKG